MTKKKIVSSLEDPGLDPHLDFLPAQLPVGGWDAERTVRLVLNG